MRWNEKARDRRKRIISGKETGTIRRDVATLFLWTKKTVGRYIVCLKEGRKG